MMDPSYPFVPPDGTRKRTTSSSANAPGTSRGEPARRSRKRPLSATAVLSQPTASPSSSTPPPSTPPARASMSAAQLLSRAMNRSSAPPPAASLPEAPPAAAENPTQEPPRKRARHVKKLLAQALALSRSCAHDATAAAMAAAGRSAVSESSGSGFSSDEDIECGRLEQVLQEVVNNLAKTHQRVTGLRDLAQRNVLEMQPPMQPPMFQVRAHVPMYSPMPVPMHPALPRSQAQQQRLLMRAQAQEQRESDRSFWPLLCFSPEQRVHMVQAARELARKPEHALHNLPLALSFSDCGNLVSKLVPKPLGLEDVPYVNVDLAGSINSCSAPFSKQLNAGTPEDLVGDAIRQYFESSADIARVEKELQLIGSRQCDMTINIVTMLSRDRTCAVDVLDLCMGVRDKSGALCAFRAYTFPFATRAARVKTARPGDEPST